MDMGNNAPGYTDKMSPWDVWRVAEALNAKVVIPDHHDNYGNCYEDPSYLDFIVSHKSKEKQIDMRAVSLLPGARYLVNPGSVGAPRDGDPRAGYAIVDLERGWLRFGRVAYPVEEVVRALRRAGLPPVLGERLQEGR